MLNPQTWHARFQQQAAWTAALRQHLLQVVHANSCDRILETGCGTGALTTEIQQSTLRQLYGIDLDLTRLAFAQKEDPAGHFCCADGLNLPFANGSFDMTICHFYLLWVSDPLQALVEMRRVTRPGGWILALAEPDYGGRIDHPSELAFLGLLQTQSLRAQGADPQIGRQLPSLFLRAGLRQVHSGLLGGEWQHPDPEDNELEWEVLIQDLHGLVSSKDLQNYRQMEELARLSGERILFIPTFYAFGQA